MSDELLRQIKLNGSPPAHVAIIMDGNGRWARGRALPRPFGHKAGMKSVREVVEGALSAGVEVLTLFAFSQENWQRPADEIGALMELLEEYIAREMAELKSQGVTVRFLGDLDRLSPRRNGPRSNASWPTPMAAGSWRSTSASPMGRARSSPGPRACSPRRRGPGSLDPADIDEDAIAQHLYTSRVARSRPADPHLRRAAALEFPVVAVGLRRDLRHPGLVARLPS